MTEAKPVTFEDAVGNVSAALKGETEPNSVADLRGSLATLEATKDMVADLSSTVTALHAVLIMLNERTHDAENANAAAVPHGIAGDLIKVQREARASEARGALRAAAKLVTEHVPAVAQALEARKP
jgi:uncharacterized protein (DUF2267 family)